MPPVEGGAARAGAPPFGAPRPVDRAPPVPASATRAPSLAAQLGLLWKLRLTLARGTFPRGRALIVPVLGTLALGGGGGATFVATRALLESPLVADARLELFLLLLVGFFVSTMWMLWPVVTAGVDDAAELSRFALFPVSSGRLFLASVVAALFEPRTLPFWGTLLGSGTAVCERDHASVPWMLAATTALAFASVVWGRVGLHLVLNVLRHRQSAEAMGAGLLVLLGLAALVPPPDLTWLKEVPHGLGAVDVHLIAGGVFLFSALPTGAWAWTLTASAAHLPSLAIVELGYLGCTTVVGYVVALWLLEWFHRRAGRALPQPVKTPARVLPFGSGSLFRVLWKRELADLLRNPRVRLMLALPFFLAILLKLVGARAFAEVLAGPQADAWIAGGLASYAALVVGTGLAQNLFGYDAEGTALFLAAPVDFRLVLRAKNLAVGGLAGSLVAAILLFDAVYLGRPALWIELTVVPVAACQVLLSLAAGNILSIVSPRRFHATLRRRDRAPPLSTAVGFGVAALAILPGSLVLETFANQTLPLPLIVGAWLLPALAYAGWRASLVAAVRLLESRRPQLLWAVTRS